MTETIVKLDHFVKTNINILFDICERILKLAYTDLINTSVALYLTMYIYYKKQSLELKNLLL